MATNLATLRFSISDGASTAARSEVWSRLLTDAFVRGDDPLETNTLAELRREWSRLVFLTGLPWFAREKLTQGSAATFIGLTLHENRYQVTAVGDSCVFHISGDELILSGPLTDWTQFSRFPMLVSTKAEAVLAEDQRWSTEGQFTQGDVFLLATDAVAKHFLRRYAQTKTMLPICDHVAEQVEFEEYIELERENGLDNDDCTVCVVRT